MAITIARVVLNADLISLNYESISNRQIASEPPVYLNDTQCMYLNHGISTFVGN